STTSDDGYVGKDVCYLVSGSNGGHAMTIVGYDDNIWVDLNNNNVVDSGEKGAFRIANSWGTYWKDGGFTWCSYNAVKKGGWWYNNAYWITAKANYKPLLLGQFTINTQERDKVSAYVGYSSLAQSTPSKVWNPSVPFNNGGPYAFDGSTTPCDASFIEDFTDLVMQNNLDTSSDWRMYVNINDIVSGNVTTLKDYKLIKPSTGEEFSYIGTLPQKADMSVISPYIQYKFSSLPEPLISAASPANNSIEIPLNSNIILTFNKPVVPVTTKKIEIRKFSDDSLYESINVDDSTKVTVSSNKVTINPGKDFLLGEKFYVLIDSGAFKDNVGNPFKGIVSNTDLSFTATAIAVPVTGVKVSPTTATINAGKTLSLTAIVSPLTATDSTISWSSSNGAVATVDSKGVVTAVSGGSATITAKSNQNTLKTATCVVTVPVPVSGITLTPSVSTLLIGKTTGTVAVNFTPSNAANKTVTWTSDKPNVVSVSSTGLISPVSEGTATITATTSDGGYKATCSIKSIYGVNSLSLDRSSILFKVGASDIQLTASISPTNASIKDITWTSSDPSIATVNSSGIVHAVANGKVTITVVSTQDSAKKATCSVTVASGIALSKSAVTLKIGKTTASLTATLLPSNLSISALKWTSDRPDIATVSGAGVVTPLSEGTATITATSNDGGLTATCTVTSIYGVDNITLDNSSLLLKVGDSDVTLVPTFSPANATIKDLTWSSSAPSVATVSSTGVVHVVATGTATITATSVQDNTRKAVCSVTVASALVLSQSSITLKIGQTTGALSAKLAPLNKSISGIIWSSSDSSVATVSSTGRVTPLKEGSAVITAATTDGKLASACTVICIYGLNSFTIDRKSILINVGAKDITLVPQYNPSNATSKNLIWTSSDTNVATVSSSGVVHAVGLGTAIITATYEQDSAKKVNCSVTVTSGITLSQSAVTLKIGQSTARLTASLTPANTVISAVTWTSDKPEVASVSSSGVITPKSEGTATITAASIDGGYTAACSVTCIYGLSSVTLDRKSILFNVGAGDITLIPAYSPINASVKSLTWTSSDTSVATVDASGVVHAVANGVATITATSVQDNAKKATCLVTVASGISLSQTSLTQKIGQAGARLVAKLIPSGTEISAINWTSDKPEVATVNTSGVITARSEGTAIITAATKDGGFTATCTVTSIYGLSSVTLSRTPIIIKVGAADVTLSPVFYPVNATIKDLSWTSSNTSVATVDSSGVVHAVGSGTATITATSAQDSSKKAYSYITVIN
ncbi:MAG: Ig-like domain-containing protein, partial [Bacillota bacterium]|nr:Ig-like domain-containing protein [Bacillota bacterium]